MKTPRELLQSLRALMAEAPEDEPETSIALEAGQQTVVEAARSGVFVDMHGTRVEFTPAVLADMAASFDANEDHKIKIGHKPIDTDSPDFGDVIGLAYDEGKDRLLATIVPTPITVTKNRTEGFRRASLEARGKSRSGPWIFEHLALLGARRPGVDQLSPIALAAEGGEGVSVFLEAVPEPEPRPEVLLSNIPVDKPANVSPQAEQKPKDGANTMEPTEQIAAEKARADRFKAKLAAGAADQAKAFVAANQKRIPLALMKASVENGLAALLALEVESDAAVEIKFAGADGKETAEAPSAFLMRILAALPEQVSATETTETAADGHDRPTPTTIQAAFPLDAGSVEIDLAVRDEIAARKAKGENVTYFDAYKAISGRASA